MIGYSLARTLLFRLGAENAHDLALPALSSAHALGLSRLLCRREQAPVRVFGIDFPNPVGLAAGLDKNGAHAAGLAALGFGFIEVGTTTPRPQPGNPKPRIFRLEQEQALINRLGFNNDGVEQLVRNLDRVDLPCPLGINIGKNKTTPNEDAVDDYLRCLDQVYARADYITVNISSPNTEGLRELQAAQPLRQLIDALTNRRAALASRHGGVKPLLVKLAPDLETSQIDILADVIGNSDIDGVIATNTTIKRPGLDRHPLAAETGGLSGVPLRPLAQSAFTALRRALPQDKPMIGVGGINSGADAAERLKAGADLLQIYTGLIYQGPDLITACVKAARELKDAGAAAA